MIAMSCLTLVKTLTSTTMAQKIGLEGNLSKETVEQVSVCEHFVKLGEALQI